MKVYWIETRDWNDPDAEWYKPKWNHVYSSAEKALDALKLDALKDYSSVSITLDGDYVELHTSTGCTYTYKLRESSIL